MNTEVNLFLYKTWLTSPTIFPTFISYSSRDLIGEPRNPDDLFFSYFLKLGV